MTDQVLCFGFLCDPVPEDWPKHTNGGELVLGRDQVVCKKRDRHPKRKADREILDVGVCLTDCLEIKSCDKPDYCLIIAKDKMKNKCRNVLLFPNRP